MQPTIFDIVKAHEIYEKLARDYPDDRDGLRKVFETKRDRYGAIARDLERLQEVTERGELDLATRFLAALKRREPDVPFDSLVRLPVRVESTPPGASVFVDDERVGVTPVVTSYRPAGEPHIRVELPGFETVVHTVTNKVGLLIKVAWCGRRSGRDRPRA